MEGQVLVELVLGRGRVRPVAGWVLAGEEAAVRAALVVVWKGENSQFKYLIMKKLRILTRHGYCACFPKKLMISHLFLFYHANNFRTGAHLIARNSDCFL